MGKGDKKTKRGKIFAGSFGKARPKPNKNKKHKAAPLDPGAKTEEKNKKPAAKPAEKKPVVKKAPAKKKETKAEAKEEKKAPEEKKEAAQEEEE